MTGEATPVIFVTANVGSIFEEPTRMVQAWANEFLSTISRLDPKFVALHCQEVGGKNYEKSMQYVDDFVKLLLASDELRLFDKVRIYLDKDFSSADKFTALGNFYFIHESLTDVLLYNFSSRSFHEVQGTQVFSDDMEDEQTKEKSKFPLEYFPECKWSRKGFLRTRWSINGSVFDLVNIHLFHDASNFVAIESYPSEYCQTRRQALTYTLDRFHNDQHEVAPVFIFGDFNFRADTQAVVNRLSEGLCRSMTEEIGDDSTVDYTDGDAKVLRVGKKTFSHSKHQDLFADLDAKWLREFDKELESFSDQLVEFAITFQPSYPFEEGETCGKQYMQTRCPAWCDRVLLTKDALPLVKSISDSPIVEYGLIGRNTCMGDHKPVFLKMEINSNIAKCPNGESRPCFVAGETPNAEGDAPDRVTGLVKRVNSASFVENRGRREDWQSARCNSDVSWNPVAVASGGMRKPLLHGSSRIRLVSPTASVHCSLPRLTSHHSSSDEEWFEVVAGDDDVMEVEVEPTPVPAEMEPKKVSTNRKSFSIFKRLSIKESRAAVESDDVTVVESEQKEAAPPPSKNYLVLKTQTLLKNVKQRSSRSSGTSSRRKTDDGESWETIDLSDPKNKQVEQEVKGQSCCVLQ